MSRLLLLSARWCTLTIRCTMGISRPSVLNTTAGGQKCGGGGEHQQEQSCVEGWPKVSRWWRYPGRQGSRRAGRARGAAKHTDVPRLGRLPGLVEEEDVAAIEAGLHAAAQHHHHLRGTRGRGVVKCQQDGGRQVAGGHSRCQLTARFCSGGWPLPNGRDLPKQRMHCLQRSRLLLLRCRHHRRRPAATATELTGDSLPVPMIMDFQIIRAEVMIMPAGKLDQL